MIYEIIQPAFFVWTAAIEQSSDARILLTIAYLICSVLSLVCQSIARKNNVDNAQVWKLVTIVNFFGFFDTIFQPEILITEILRNISVLNDLYFDRYEIQFFILGMMVITSLMLAKNMQNKYEVMMKTNVLLSAGICAVIGMFTLRLVSFHYTDLIINAKVFGISIGRLIDFAGLTCTSIGIIHWLRQRRTQKY